MDLDLNPATLQYFGGFGISPDLDLIWI